MKKSIALVLALLSCAFTLPAAAQDWPQKGPVKVIVPFAPGSSPDLFARLLADNLRKNTNQTFVVDNKPGAGGMLGTNLIAKAEPDGYTFGVSITGPLVNNTLLYKSMSYDPFKDLAPITLAVNQPCLVVVSNDIKANNIKELLDYGSFGNGTMAHLAMELLAEKSHSKMTQIPYPGVPQVVQAILGGDVSMGCLPPIGVMGQIQGGKMKAIAVASKQRWKLLPNIPTIAEQGVTGVEANSWIGIVAPAKVPGPVLSKMRAEIVKVLKDPEVIKAMEGQLMESVGGTAEEFDSYMKEELHRWGPIIREHKIQLD